MKKIILSILLCSFIFNVSMSQVCFELKYSPKSNTVFDSVIYENYLYGVTSADFNKDGIIDIVTADPITNSLSLMIGNGQGGFYSNPSKIFSFESFRIPKSVISADFNKDGINDLAVIFGAIPNNDKKQVAILLGEGSGRFSVPRFFSLTEPLVVGSNKDLTPNAIKSVDVNNDGKLDLIISNLYDSLNITVMLGDGYGDFTIGNQFSTGIGAGISMFIQDFISEDFNGDSIKDLAIIYLKSSKVQIFFGNSLGSFSLGSSFDLSGIGFPKQIISDDFNEDGKKDIAICGNSGWMIGLNDGKGSYPINNIIYLKTYTATWQSITSGDFDGDGKKDFAILGDDRVRVTYNLGNRNFSVGNEINLDKAYGSNTKKGVFIFSADVNGDGKQDLVADRWTADFTNEGIQVLLVTNPIFFVKKDVTCNGGNNGNAKAILKCVNPSDNYSYSWNTLPVQNTQTAVNLSAGTYTVTITDSSNNKFTQSIIINEPISISATHTTILNPKCSGTCNGAITINASGGTSPYTYKWDALANNQTTQTATGLCSGKYTVTITDATGCTFTKEIVLVADSGFNSQVYLTNIAAVDQVNVSTAFSSFYTYNLPAKITPNPTNLRNFVDPGKKARFKVECTNKKTNGQSIVSGVCQVKSHCPYITITDDSSALNNIGWNNKAWSADEFEIDIKPNTPPGTIAYIDFIVIENGVEYPSTCIPLPITPLNYSPTTSATIDDDNNPDSKGNDNDICEPNEIIEFYPWLDNVSTLNAEFVRGRFENLDNLNYINIWNNKAGVNTTVFDSTWWNFSFAKPSVINSSSKNMTPEFDFVFNYNNSKIVNNFKLYMVMAGGFKLFPGNALSLVQWSLPYTFNGSTLAIDNFSMDNTLLIYPNPTNSFLNIKSNNNTIFNKIVVTDLTGKIILIQTQNTNQINIQNLAKGIYILEAFEDSEKITNKFIKE